jgi:hypothetical protein
MYICDFVEVIKMCKFKLYKLYHDPKCKFGGEAFNTFHSLLIGNDDGFPLTLLNHPLMMMIGVLQGSIVTKF